MIDKLFLWAKVCDADFFTLKQFMKVLDRGKIIPHYELTFMVTSSNTSFDYIEVYCPIDKIVEEVRNKLTLSSLHGRAFNQMFPIEQEEELNFL